MSLVPGLALVTGASAPLGRELVRCFAADGYAVVAAAGDPGVHDLAAGLSAGGAAVVPVQVDLASPEGVERLHAAVLDQPEILQAVVFGDAVPTAGRQDVLPLTTDLRAVDRDVRATVHLAKLLLPDLVHRASGRLMFVSTDAGEAPAPHRATYAASTAFVHAYAEAVRQEVRPSGLTVTTMVTGAGDDHLSGAAAAAREGYDAMQRGADRVVTGSRGLISTAVAKVVPDRLTAAVTARQP